MPSNEPGEYLNVNTQKNTTDTAEESSTNGSEPTKAITTTTTSLTDIQKAELTKDLSKDESLALGLILYNDVREAGRFAGYSESSLKTGWIYRKVKQPKFQQTLRDIAIQHDLLNVPQILKIEAKVLEHLAEGDNFKELPKFKDVIKQKKTIAGILRPEPEGQKVALINIKEVRNLMVKAGE